TGGPDSGSFSTFTAEPRWPMLQLPMSVNHSLRRVLSVSCLAVFALTGCQSEPPGPAPVGPGAATSTDLAAWTTDAKEVTITGTLWEFNVAGATGSYDTWGLAAASGTTGTRTLGLDSAEGVEVDVRRCVGAAQR